MVAGTGCATKFLVGRADNPVKELTQFWNNHNKSPFYIDPELGICYSDSLRHFSVLGVLSLLDKLIESAQKEAQHQ